MFWLIHSSAFFSCIMLNLGVYTELRTEVFVKSIRVNCSNSINHDWVQVLSYIKVKTKLATIVEGNQKAPCSIATIPTCRGGYYSIPWIVPLYP